VAVHRQADVRRAFRRSKVTMYGSISLLATPLSPYLRLIQDPLTNRSSIVTAELFALLEIRSPLPLRPGARPAPSAARPGSPLWTPSVSLC
jgi:hypothetical protein